MKEQSCKEALIRHTPQTLNPYPHPLDKDVRGQNHFYKSKFLEVEIINPMQSNNRGGNIVRTMVPEETGVFLTWEDLWVTVPNGKEGRKSILEGVTGYAQPDELLAIMGPSGCGKSTLLDALAGRSGSNTRQSGNILINGLKQKLGFGTTAYVTQDDTLMTTLTVLEAITVYFGPASTATEFFATNGFPCPTLQNPSDHFLKTINKDFGKDLEQGLDGGIPIEEAINSLTSSYKSSEIHQEVRRQVSEICKQDWGALEKKRNHAGFVIQCLVLTRRSFVNMYRDIGYYWLRLAIYVALAMGLATVFYDVGSSYAYASIQVRGSLIMFITSFLTFMTIGGFPSFVEDMKVFNRERLNGHYGTTAFIISNSLSAIPYLLLISLIPGAIAYYPSGLQKGAEHFLFFASIIFSCMMLVESLMMIVASVVPNLLMGIITGAGVQGLMMLGGGIFRYPNDLFKPFWKYPLYYISFHKYAYQGLFKNEFEKLTFSIDEAEGPTNISGKEVLRNELQMEMGYSKWVDLAILLGMVVLYRLLFLGFVKTTEMIKPFVTTFMSAPPKQTTQVMVNPSIAPLV
ncbi:hypothetical protein CMV_001227 [Castanea mollissima]|uniref:ABC transporter domain-containing protein n=1 Tax=Castanea mollissima TaxID=60419 RepID=A0A8J4S0L5_9ROSI|nr:hypothetical protein CMV_001227 [Castanea mollissima]